MAERTPWSRLLVLALGFGVQPAAFWRLSVREWRALASPIDTTLSRAAFEALARHYPDETR
jgi:uncharacterized phage protein (TIGR02216 family)